MIPSGIINMWNEGIPGKSLLFLIIFAVISVVSIFIFLIYKAIDYFLGENKKGYAIIIDKCVKDVKKTNLLPCVPIGSMPIADELKELTLKVENEDGICEIRVENDYYEKAYIGQKALITYSRGYISRKLYKSNIQ